MIGHVLGVKVGQTFPDRKALHAANVHRGLMNGIAPQGASIVLSGGYIDDEDDGDEIKYTGEGGRNPNSGRQISDQSFTGGNYNLAHNASIGNPIRVIRGHQLHSPFAPSKGYRYDGLYRIDNYWSEQGRDGFLVWRYRLIRIEEQPPIGNLESIPQIPLGSAQPPRSTAIVSRVIRSTQIGNTAKELYDYRCQICGTRLETPSGAYAESCHIKPLGKPHNGPDTLDNVLCLCPNCHALFDMHALTIQDDLFIPEIGHKLRLRSEHKLKQDYLSYHRTLSRRN
ncbi:YDG/SRA domain-containing protein [Chloroflexota bacterium]